VVLPLVTSAVSNGRSANGWWEARRDPTGLAPDPAAHRGAVVQVYAARTFGWRGAFGVHTWFAIKPRGATDYTRVEVIGWGVGRGRHAVRISKGNPDNYWFDNYPDVLVDIRGARAEPLVAKILDAAKAYPFPQEYRVWPGPNSNTFTAFVARQVPELVLDLPPQAIGKDYLASDRFVSQAPSGTGYQASLFGLLGVLLAWEEGVEINLLGLTIGLDVKDPAIKLPGLGRLGKD
jgi:hypothetical protein